jgi:hypothetical protein
LGKNLTCYSVIQDTDNPRFVGLTPGIMVSYAALRWMIGFLTNKRGVTKGKERHGFRRIIRLVPTYCLIFPHYGTDWQGLKETSTES